jgi:hypothetical protein
MTNRSTSIWLLLFNLTFTARFLDGSSSAGCGEIGFSNPNLRQEASVLQRPSYDFGLHGDHKVLDSAGLPLRSGDETSDFEDDIPSDKLGSFVLDLASHGSLGQDGDIKKEKALRCNSLLHQQDTSGRPLPEFPDSKSLSNAALKTLSKWQVFPSIPPYLHRTAVRGATPRAACPEIPLHPQRGEPANATTARSDTARHRAARTRQSQSGRRNFSPSRHL